MSYTFFELTIFFIIFIDEYILKLVIWLSDCLCELRVKSFRISLNFVIFWNSESGQKTKNPKKTFGEAYDTMASIFLIAIFLIAIFLIAILAHFKR